MTFTTSTKAHLHGNVLRGDVVRQHVLTHSVVRSVDGVDDEHVLQIRASCGVTPSDVVIPTEGNLQTTTA